MRKPIGEILIEKGLISRAQLDVALKNQLILGGHLGTCLLELGFVGEDLLAQALTEALAVPLATSADLRKAREAALRCLPRKLVEEYKVVPLDLADRTLHVAMIDPTDLLALDVLSFTSGFTIAPRVALEVRILEAMDRYYDVPRRLRYITIARSSDGVRGAASPVMERTSVVPVVAEAAHASGRPIEAGAAVPGSEFGYGRSWVEVAEELFGAAHGDRERAVSGGDAQEAADTATARLADLLCAANDKHDVATGVLDHAMTTMARALLLAVRGGEASLWDSRGYPPRPEEGRPVAFPVGPGTVLDLLSGNEYYRGPLPEEDRYLDLFRRLGTQPPVEVFLAPVRLNDRLVAVLLGDGGPGLPLEGDTIAYLGLARMLATALNLIVLKNKIRQAEPFALAGRHGPAQFVVSPDRTPLDPPSGPGS